MQFAFNERKAAQAAAYILRRHGGHFNYMHLLKLLYLADREKLLACGSPITGDRMISMEWGPTLSTLLNKTKRPERETVWAEYISAPKKYDVTLLVEDFQTDELSRFELRTLDAVDGKFGTWDVFELSDWMHKNLREYEHPGKSSKTIPPERVLRVEGRTTEEVEDVAAAAGADWELQTLIDKSR